MVDVKEQIQKDGIFKASRYKEFDAYRNYMSFDKVYVINRTEKSAFHPKNIALFIEFASFIRQIRPDVINVVGGIDVLSSILLKFRKKLVLTVHDPFPHTGEQSFRREFFRKLALKTFPRFVLLNKSQKNDFIKAYKLRADQVFTTRLGVYDCIYNFVKDGGGDGANNVLFFGRISPYKGIEYLLRAMKIVHCRIPDATLTVAGGGRMYYSRNGDELKKFNTRDGMGLQMLREAGIKTGIITSEDTQIVSNRAKKLKVDFLCQGKRNGGKLTVAKEICAHIGITLQEVAYIGDDINCLDLLDAAGLKACPADACLKVKSVQGIKVLKSKGGDGCVREFIEEILGSIRGE